MAKALYKKLISQFKSDQRPLPSPWNNLPKVLAYRDDIYNYPLRTGTMPTSVKLYGPILNAAERFESKDHPGDTFPFILIEKRGITSSQTILEAGMPDGTSLIVEASSTKLRATIYESDGTRSPTVAFKDMDENTISCFFLALLPDILAIDQNDGRSLLSHAIKELGAAVDASAANPWTSANDIPDVAKEAAYYLDASLSVLNEKLDLDCGENTSDTPAEIDGSFFRHPERIQGSLIAENRNNGTWTPLLVTANGVATKYRTGRITIADAKQEYADFAAHRNWTPEEKALIPVFPADMPVMPEVVRMANRIMRTRNDVNPVCNLMWRGETGFGKSTGMKQLACVLNVPFLTQTCHPGMEASDLKSMFVPDSDPDDGTASIPVLTAEKPKEAPSTPEASFAWAFHNVQGMEPSARKHLLDDTEAFFIQALMDQEAAEKALFGASVNADLPDLLAIYLEVHKAVQEQDYKKKLHEMEAKMTSTDTNAGNEQPQFIHVVSPYIKAMTNGYIVEIQEASRIRDPGVLVSINEFDRPGAMLPLMNGKTAVRHKDAICVITDNVGYASCRPIDPSVLRRQGMIIDSYDLSEEMLKERVKRNTGVTDTQFLDLAYKLWNCVRETCAQNSITEGSVSPMELERFVQAVKYDGDDSIGYNLDDCIISKATSNIDDQKIIRTNCQVIYGINK